MGVKTLYKYLDAEGGLKMLKHSNLQFTNATCLNDPFDCHQALFDYSNAPELESGWPSADFISSMEEKFNERQREKTWICSLSRIHDSLLMWSYYGSHRGVCIGLNMEKVRMLLSEIICRDSVGVIEMDVLYKDIINKPDFFNSSQDYVSYQLSTKAKAWEHEQEVRLLLIDPTCDSVPMALPYKQKTIKKFTDDDWKEVRLYPMISPECFDSVYLGVKIDKEGKEKIIQEARRLNPEINIYQMTTAPKAFSLEEELVK